MKYLIWDFDGTLGYREGGMWAATLFEILQQELPASPVTMEQLQPNLQAGFYWHAPETPHTAIVEAAQWWETLNQRFAHAYMAVGIDETVAWHMARRVREVYPALPHWRLFADTLPVLDRLTDLGWMHIILTNHVPEFPTIFQHLGLTSRFAAVFNSAQTGYEKPHLQAFRKVLDFIGKPEAVWMIGDSYTADVLGAEAVGIPGILVRKPHIGAKYCCEALSQVEGIVGRGVALPQGARYDPSIQ
ncbi:MAG TPA: HAD family hydrolase [Armatimonadota bacterium]|jgi:putative hydrolase of the HAD superfamily